MHFGVYWPVRIYIRWYVLENSSESVWKRRYEDVQIDLIDPLLSYRTSNHASNGHISHGKRSFSKYLQSS